MILNDVYGATGYCNIVLLSVISSITGFLEFIHNLAGLLEHHCLENETASVLRDEGE